MSREDAKKLLEAVTSKGLFTAIVFYKSPITEQPEERHIYADDNSECINWANYRLESCKNYNLPCEIYVNGSHYASHRSGETFPYNN